MFPSSVGRAEPSVIVPPGVYRPKTTTVTPPDACHAAEASLSLPFLWYNCEMPSANSYVEHVAYKQWSYFWKLWKLLGGKV